MIPKKTKRIKKLFKNILVPRTSTQTYYLRDRLNYNRQGEGTKAAFLPISGLAKIK